LLVESFLLILLCNGRHGCWYCGVGDDRWL
jgi:hypothetical protein